MKISKVGILGAGTMGGGIAQVVAQAGFQVGLLDLSEALVRGGVEKIEKSLARSVEKKKFSPQEKEDTLKRIRPTIDIQDLRDSELIIEAVFEDLNLKKALFKKLDVACPTDTTFASNTSTLSITRMAAEVSQSKRFLGLHFFNPVPAMKLVEVISGLQTSPETVETGLDFVKRIKKIPIEVKDCPGFLVNRILLPYVGEAMLAAQEEAASPQEIDESVKKIGFPMGPLTLNDMVGIDVGDHTFPVMYEAYGERFPVPLLFGRLLKAGRLGMK
jgi:3-hydroxybutyryl-CoA dehydrogenase